MSDWRDETLRRETLYGPLVMDGWMGRRQAVGSELRGKVHDDGSYSQTILTEQPDGVPYAHTVTVSAHDVAAWRAANPGSGVREILDAV